MLMADNWDRGQEGQFENAAISRKRETFDIQRTVHHDIFL